MEGDGKRILVVDDNRDIRRMVSLLLMSAGYSVSEAGDGAEAVAELQKRRYEVILTDVRMPHLNGRDLLKICRDLYPLTPVIVLSSDFHSPADDHPPVSAEDGAGTSCVVRRLASVKSSHARGAAPGVGTPRTPTTRGSLFASQKR